MPKLTAPNGASVSVADGNVDELLRRGFKRVGAPVKKAAAKKAPAKKAAKKSAAKKSSK